MTEDPPTNIHVTEDGTIITTWGEVEIQTVQIIDHALTPKEIRDTYKADE